MSKNKTHVFSRRHFIRTSALATTGALGAFSYARWIEPNQLSVTRKHISIPGLPTSLDGLIIAHLTDFHYDPNQHNELIEEAVKITNEAQPDIIALTGDFITKNPKVFAPLMQHLSQLQAKIGVYGIMGNHDGWHAPYSMFRKEFQRSGFDFLINENSQINIKGENLMVFGTDSIWAGHLDLPACYRGHHKGSSVLALVHEPDVFDLLRDRYPVQLQLSGHTHGGQCRVPLIGYAPIKVKYGEKYIYGEFARENSRLFVSRGLGSVGVPVRFACPPEVALLTLSSTPQK
jgi:predicted MPP superfamily phosphohydrolase